MSDILTIKRQLAERAQEVCEYLLPRGRLYHREWLCGSTAGEPGESMKVCVSGAKAGVWTDFAEGGGGGDLIDLWCVIKSVQLTEALDQCREFLGIPNPGFSSLNGKKPEKQYRRPDAPKCVKPKSAVLEYLASDRKLTPEAVAAYRIGEDDRTIVFRSFLPNGDLAFVKYLGVDRRDGKKVTRVEAECEPVLFGWQAIPENSREVVICEGEIDAVTMWDYGFPALSVPFGGGKGNKQQWIECEFDRLARFEVIYLALDMDAEGDLAAEEIANRIGRHRCQRVALPHKDANECRKANVSGAEIQKCFDESANLDPPELRQPGEFVEDVIKLFWPTGDSEPGYRLPFVNLRDKLIFRPGEVSIWTGPTGAGKSQLLSHACVGFGEQGAKMCIASLEMAPRQLVKRMVKQAGNTDRPTEPYIRKIVGWLDLCTWIFAVVGKSRITRMIEIFEYARARYGCDVFVVDSLMRLGVGSEDYEGQEKAVFELVNWSGEKNVHVHLVAHARKADRQAGGIPDSEDIKGASEIASNAFNILAVWRNKKLEEQQSQVAEGDKANAESADIADMPPVVLNIPKQRNGDFEGKTGLWFNRETYQYRASRDNPAGTDYVRLEQ